MPEINRIKVIPEGKIVDFIDKKIRKDTPQEYIRQNIEKGFLYELKYPREEIAIDFSIKVESRRRKADIVVFHEGMTRDQEYVYIIAQTKAPSISQNHRTNGVEQLKTFMIACPRCKFGLWTNGKERVCLQKIEKRFEYDFQEIVDIPGKGQTLDDLSKVDKSRLKKATADNLRFTFNRCHDYIAGNQGLSKQQAFWELVKLIFCKIQDERSQSLKFWSTGEDRSFLNGQLRVKERIDRIFKDVKRSYPAIFSDNDEITLEPRVLAYTVSQLMNYDLLNSSIDVKGTAYETIVGANLRGDRGEFFTPRNVCGLAVRMLSPQPSHKIIDPACGTGGFLIIGLKHVMDIIKHTTGEGWEDSARQYAQQLIFGVDLNPDLVKASKMNMVMNNDGSGGLFAENSLLNPQMWSEETRKYIRLGTFDILLTNPPFGSKIPVDDSAILDQYDLAHRWAKTSDGSWVMQGELQKSLPPEILFIERSVQLLKPGTGKMAIVLPDGVLGNPDGEYIRYWILKNTEVLASIDLPVETFLPHTGTQTSVLFLRRKSEEEKMRETIGGTSEEYPVFMAIAEKVGWDRRGNTIYKKNQEGKEIVVPVRIQEQDEYGSIQESVIEQKIVDDDLDEIAEAYLKFLDKLEKGQKDEIYSYTI